MPHAVYGTAKKESLLYIVGSSTGETAKEDNMFWRLCTNSNPNGYCKRGRWRYPRGTINQGGSLEFEGSVRNCCSVLLLPLLKDLVESTKRLRRNPFIGKWVLLFGFFLEDHLFLQKLFHFSIFSPLFFEERQKWIHPYF